MKRQRKHNPRAYRAGKRVGWWIGAAAALLVFVGIPVAVVYGIAQLVASL